MPNLFAITAASNTVLLDAHRQGEAAFTVANLSGRAIRGRALVTPQSQDTTNWLTLAGTAERDFVIAGVQPYLVKIAVPLPASPGSYAFRLDMVAVANPDDTLTQGPTVTFVVPDAPPPPPAKKPFPWWIVAVIVGVLVVGGIIAFLVFRNVTVPDVVGRPLAEAQQTLREANLSVGTTSDRVTGSAAPNTVLEQNPAAGQSVNRNAPVDLVVEAPLVTVPNVVGQNRSAAQQSLSAVGLREGSVSDRVTGAPPGVVLEQNPVAGTQMVRNSAVALVLEAPRVTVPNVVGQVRAAAQQVITNADLRVGAVNVQGTLTRNVNTVITQNPAAGQQALRNSTVNLTVEADRASSGRRAIPDDNAINLDNGQVGTGAGADLRLDTRTVGGFPLEFVRELQGLGSVRLATVNNQADRLAACQTALANNARTVIPLDDLGEGSRVCIRTNENRITEVTIVDIPPITAPGALTIDYVTWVN